MGMDMNPSMKISSLERSKRQGSDIFLNLFFYLYFSNYFFRPAIWLERYSRELSKNGAGQESIARREQIIIKCLIINRAGPKM